MVYRCRICGRQYRSTGWLSRHVRREHGGPSPETWAASSQAPSLFRDLEGRTGGLEEACQALGIAMEDVMSHRVYSDKVVLIEGPVGYKRVYGLQGCVGRLT